MLAMCSSENRNRVVSDDNNNGLPPEHVRQAALVVNRWLADRESALAGAAAASAAPAAAADKTASMSAAQKLDWARTHDQSKMPAWKDPRLP